LIEQIIAMVVAQSCFWYFRLQIYSKEEHIVWLYMGDHHHHIANFSVQMPTKRKKWAADSFQIFFIFFIFISMQLYCLEELISNFLRSERTSPPHCKFPCAKAHIKEEMSCWCFLIFSKPWWIDSIHLKVLQRSVKK